MKDLRFFIGSLAATLHLVANFSSKGIFVVHQGKSPSLEILPAAEAVVMIIFKVSLLCSPVILAVRVKIFDSCEDLHFLILVDFGIASEDISKLREPVSSLLKAKGSLKLIDLETLYFLALFGLGSLAIRR